MSILALTLELLLATSANTPRQDGSLDDEPPSVRVAGDCPREDEVVAALQAVVGKGPISGSAPGSPVVSDLGDGFEVTAAGQTGRYSEPTRNCMERARMAAVFIGLALSPPTANSAVVSPPVAAPPTPPATETVRVAPEPPSPREDWAHLGAAARFDGASSANGVLSDLTMGAELQGAMGRNRWGLVAGAAVLAPTTSTYGSVSVRQQRFPFHLATRLRARLFGSLELGTDLGVSVVVLTARGEGLDRTDPATRLDAGGRLSFEVRFPALARSLFPFVAVSGEFFPRPYLFRVQPLGEIGETRRLWLGLSAGLSLGR